MKKKLTAIAFCFFVLTSCDIPGKIIIVNTTSKEATYRCLFSEKDSVIELKIKPDKNHNKSGIFFGFGHRWTNNTIRQYVSTINKIEIFSSQDTLVFTDKEKIYNFFKTRRKGLFKDKIEVIIY